jgi:hypothetical protein
MRKQGIKFLSLVGSAFAAFVFMGMASNTSTSHDDDLTLSLPPRSTASFLKRAHQYSEQLTRLPEPLGMDGNRRL